MKIECTIRRPKGSTVDLSKFGGGTYTFAPVEPGGPHLCDIPDDQEAAISRLLSIPSSFRVFTGRAAADRPQRVGYIDTGEQDRLAATEASKAKDAAHRRLQEEINAMSKAELIEFAKNVFDLHLSPEKNIGALRRAVIEAAEKPPAGTEKDVQELRQRAASLQSETPPAENIKLDEE